MSAAHAGLRPSHQRWPFAAGAVAIAIALLAGSTWFARPSAMRVPVRVTASPAVATDPLPMLASLPPTSAGVRSLPAATVARDDRDEALCSAATNESDASEQTDHDPAWRRRALPWLRQAEQRLADSLEPRERAAALLVGEPADWPADEWARRLDALVRDAQASHDATVYALTLAACERPHPQIGDSAACEGLSPEQLARLEPDNAAPWLRIAGAARLNQSPAAEAEAVYQASTARRYDNHRSLVLRALDAALPAQTPAWARYGLLRARAQRRVQPDAWVMMAVAGHCSADAVRDANVRQVCEALARPLLASGADPDVRLSGLLAASAVGGYEPPKADPQALMRQVAELPTAGRAACGDARRWIAAVRALGA